MSFFKQFYKFGFRIIIITILTTCFSDGSNVGSTIFFKRNARECWSAADVAKLQARRQFGKLMPPPITPDKVDEKYTKNVLRYFQDSLLATSKISDHQTSIITKEALSDAIGGHLRSELLPTIRFAYYAGYIPHKNARMVHDLYDQLKFNLNTQGQGWLEPEQVPRWTNLSVYKLFIGPGKRIRPCRCLVWKRDTNSCVHIPLPKLDNKIAPAAIALPFKSGGFVSLTEPQSENILLNYYSTVLRCILQSSPKNCRHGDFVNFNNELWHWMKRDVAPHLVDEKLYSAYGGVLRIAAAVQSYGKGLARRNLFEYQEAKVSKWHPWQYFRRSYFIINTNSRAQFYILLVMSAAAVICLLQICCHYLCGNAGCCCKGVRDTSSPREVATAYSNVESNYPAALPSPSNVVYYSEIMRSRKSSSTGSVRTQKVYDLNENTEKLMAIMSENEESDDGPRSTDSVENDVLRKNIRSKSPPKIETSMAELRLNSTPRTRTRTAMYSTSTLTHSEFTSRFEPVSGSIWSGSTSSSEESISSCTSIPCKSRLSRNTRDLAWARRVVVKSALSQNKSGTEVDGTSFITPPSQR